MIETLLLNWKLVVIGALLVGLGMMSSLYVSKRDELITFTAQVEAAGLAQQAKNAETKARYEDNLITIRSEHEAHVNEIRDSAVAAYRAHFAGVRTYPGRRGVPSAPASLKVDDDPKQELVLDPAFLEDAAEDAAKLAAFQDYCRYNGCPVTP